MADATASILNNLETSEKQPSQIGIGKIYSKNHRFEIKGAPTTVKTPTWNPVIDLQANPRFTEVGENQYEVVLAMQFNVKQEEDVQLQVYLEQAGMFTLTNIPSEQSQTVLYGVCPNMLFPYAGVSLNQHLSAAGLPPVYLAPMDFINLYRKHLAEQKDKEAEKPIH